MTRSGTAALEPEMRLLCSELQTTLLALNRSPLDCDRRKTFYLIEALLTICICFSVRVAGPVSFLKHTASQILTFHQRRPTQQHCHHTSVHLSLSLRYRKEHWDIKTKNYLEVDLDPPTDKLFPGNNWYLKIRLQSLVD